MLRIRLNQDLVDMLEGQAEHGEDVQDTLRRILEIRYRETAYPDKRGLTYKDLARRWDCSPQLVKHRVSQYRQSGGEVGLGPIIKLGARKCLVPWEAIEAYEKAGVY